MKIHDSLCKLSYVQHRRVRWLPVLLINSCRWSRHVHSRCGSWDNVRYPEQRQLFELSAAQKIWSGALRATDSHFLMSLLTILNLEIFLSFWVLFCWCFLSPTIELPLTGNLGSWNLACKLLSTQLEEIWDKKNGGTWPPPPRIGLSL